MTYTALINSVFNKIKVEKEKSEKHFQILLVYIRMYMYKKKDRNAFIFRLNVSIKFFLNIRNNFFSC